MDFVELLSSTPLTFPDIRGPLAMISPSNFFLLSALLENLGEAFFGILSSLLLLLLPPSFLYSLVSPIFYWKNERRRIRFK